LIELVIYPVTSLVYLRAAHPLIAPVELVHFLGLENNGKALRSLVTQQACISLGTTLLSTCQPPYLR